MGIYGNLLDIEVADNRSDYEKMKADQFKRREAYERALKYKDFLDNMWGVIPYHGYALYAVIHQEVEKLVPDGHNESTWLIRKGTVLPPALRSCVKGMRADGTEFFCTSYGLVFLTTETFGEHNSTVVNGWTLPTADWLDKSHRSRRYLQVNNSYPCYISNHTTAAKLKQKEIDLYTAKQKEESINAGRTELIARLVALGEEVNDTTIQLLHFIDTHDYYYSYSDDSNVWRYHSAREAKAKSFMKAYPKLLELFGSHK